LKILFISDLHYEKKGVEVEAWQWLLSIVNRHKPDILLSAGDWGTAVSIEEFEELLEKTLVYSIYGNHDNLKVLSALQNINKTKVLIADGRIAEVYGLKVSGINGIIALRRKSRKGVPRKRPEDFINIAYSLAKSRVDILLLHETVPLAEYRGLIRFPRYLSVVIDVIRVVRPVLVLNGHLHLDHGYTFSAVDNSAYLRVDSSQQSLHYALLKDSCIEVWRDDDLVEAVQAPRVLAEKLLQVSCIVGRETCRDSTGTPSRSEETFSQ